MPKLILLMGLPASGKSTLAESFGLSVLSLDLYRRANFDEADSKKAFKAEFERRISRGISFVVDNCNLTENGRFALLNVAEAFEYETALHFLSTPLEICLERDAERKQKQQVGERKLRRMAERLQHPFDYEADEVVIVGA